MRMRSKRKEIPHCRGVYPCGDARNGNYAEHALRWHHTMYHTTGQKGYGAA